MDTHINKISILISKTCFSIHSKINKFNYLMFITYNITSNSNIIIGNNVLFAYNLLGWRIVNYECNKTIYCTMYMLTT